MQQTKLSGTLNPLPPQQRLEVDERAVFLKFELFAKRLGKLCDMFTSIHQISGLEQHTHITGAVPHCGA